MTASTSTTLTDRYVWAVLRNVPSDDRPELEREIRALIADTIESKTVDGSLGAEAAERAALTELGDPGVLATRYTGRADYLLGPNVYPVWRALVGLLLAILVPLIGVLVLAASLIAGSTIGQAIVAGIGGSFQGAVQTLFWVTLVFAVVDRVGGPKERAELSAAAAAIGTARGSRAARSSKGGPWTVDDLPDLPASGRITLPELGATIAANVFLLIALVWLQVASPIIVDGQSTPLFDPALWSFWLLWFIGVTILEIVFTIAVYVRGRWTYGYAVGNALLGAAFAIPAIYLLANDLLINPAIIDAAAAAVTDQTGTWIQATKVIIGVSIAAIVGWDAVDGFLKARRATAAAAPADAA